MAWSKKQMEYLNELSEDYDVPIDVVEMLADMLGPSELYDGLVVALEDYGDFMF